MNCYYCDKIAAVDPAYTALPAAYDLCSEAPRCARHWRYICAQCGQPAHFMATAWCVDTSRFFCSKCATAREEIEASFWCWRYYYRYRSPWTQQWRVGLDRLEFEGMHPLQRYSGSGTPPGVSRESQLVRYPMPKRQWRHEDWDDDALCESWNRNADRWNETYDDDGDGNRRYQSDEPMLNMLGEVKDLRILDVGSGQGYLSRKLARAGAEMVGVELSDRFSEIAQQRQTNEKLNITYYHANVASMPFLPDQSFDKAVSNYVLMDVRDYVAAVREVYRVLKPGGKFVVVISHPCFACGPGGWEKPAADSPRAEDRFALRVDGYFHRSAYSGVWGNFDPVTSFHRPLRDYWETFKTVGFEVKGFEEPSLTERGAREASMSRKVQAMRIPYSCICELVKVSRA